MKRWSPDHCPAPRPEAWGLNLPDPNELRTARTLFARAERCRNEVQFATSREATLEAGVRFLFNVRELALQGGPKRLRSQMFIALHWLGQLTTDFFAYECNIVARTLLAKLRGEAA
jgi:hypothetical protein